MRAKYVNRSSVSGSNKIFIKAMSSKDTDLVLGEENTHVSHQLFVTFVTHMTEINLITKESQF